MTFPVIANVLTPQLANALAASWSRRTGVELSVSAASPTSGMGWTATLPVTGVAAGQWTVWCDAASASALLAAFSDASADRTDEAIAAAFGQVVFEAAEAVAGSPDGAGLSIGTPSVKGGMAPAGAEPFRLAGANGAVVAIAVVADLGDRAVTATAQPALESGDSRLDAVLEVDLPLVVRFGRAVMPLRAVADLSPGAVVDMGRSPDEPVELLVGERLIARGEVVIVGGNYGVRITELTSGRRSTDLEARR